jgi:hypothetical protein
MNKPTRWRVKGPDEIRDLLRHAPKTRDLGPSDRARTRARVAQLGGIAAVATGLSLLQSAALGAGLAVLTLVAVEIGTTWLASSSPSPSPAPSALVVARPLTSAAPSSTSPVASSSPPLDHDHDLALALDPPARSAARRPDALPSVEVPPISPPRASDSLAEEAALIERARAALASRPAESLARTEEHAARFPTGMLGMESELVAIDALTRLGRGAEAHARAEALLARARGGIYEARLRQLLDTPK